VPVGAAVAGVPVGAAVASAHSSSAQGLLPAPAAVLSRTVLLPVYHAHPPGEVSSATPVGSYAFAAAAAARWHAAASTIRVDGAGHSLLPLTPHVYAPASAISPTVVCGAHPMVGRPQQSEPYPAVQVRGKAHLPGESACDGDWGRSSRRGH
jgi:hypothetical protein